MRNVIIFIILILFLMLCAISWNWYKATVLCCVDDSIVAVEKTTPPLVYDCNSDRAITGTNWAEHRGKIAGQENQDKFLLISSPFFDSEDDTVGLHRAKNVAGLFYGIVVRDRIITASHKTENCIASKQTLYHDTRFKWVTRNKEVVEHLEHTLIFYEYNSTKEVVSENSAGYFDELATYLLNNESNKIIITGHTDQVGSDEFNLKLGLERAREFESHLLSLGVPETRIEVKSLGRSQPIADNSTEEGRQQNRRVEIHIIKP